MRTPDQPEGDASPLSVAADDLEAHVALRTLPRPPHFLAANTLDAWDYSYPDRDRPSKATYDAVAPHWNAAVNLLDSGSGYLSLTGLRDSLRSRRKASRERVEEWDQRIYVMSLVLAAVEAERDRYGESDEVRESASELLRQAAVEGWRWVSQGDDAYLLEGAPEYALIKPSEVDRLGPFRTVFPRETWGTVADRLAHGVQDLRTRSAPDSKESELYRFRLDVVEQVVLEYEALGTVPHLSPESIRKRRLAPTDLGVYTTDRLLFLVLCKEEIDSVDPGASRREVLGGKGGEFGGVDAHAIALASQHKELADIKWHGESGGGKGKAKRLAALPPISAWRSDDAEGDDRPHFDAVIREHYDRIRSAGISTVADVALEAARRESIRQEKG